MHNSYNIVNVAGISGYGDSTGSPTEDGILEDTYHTYKWIKERCHDAPLYVWGHSLGTA
jgi:abhydrolase domain-containing protein 12